MLTAIRVRELRNLKDFRADITAPCVLLSGPVGSGKTTLLDAVRLGLDLPTRFGSTGLERLSPRLDWEVELEFSGGRRLQRRVTPAGGAVAADGRPCNQVGYRLACRKLFDLEPFHTDLGAFLELSDQRRAELFGSLLFADRTTLGAALQEGVGDLDELKVRLFATDAQYVKPEIPMDLSGSPTLVLDWIRSATNDAAVQDRKARQYVEELERRRPDRTAMSRAEADSKLQGCNVALGEIAASRRDLEQRRAAHESVARVLRDSRERVLKLQHQLADARALASKEGPRVDALAKHRELAEEAGKRHAEAKAAADAAYRGQTEITARRPLERTVELDSATILQTAAEIDIRYRGYVVGLQTPERPMVPVDELVREVLAAVDTILKGIREANQRAASEWAASLAKADDEIRAMNEWATEAWRELDRLTKLIRAQEQEVAESTEARALAARLQGELDTEEARAVELQQRLQEVAVTETDETLLVREREVQTARQAASEAIRAHDRQKGYAGQVEAARVQSSIAAATLTFWQNVLSRMQEWRNRKMQEVSRAITKPLSELVSRLLDGAKVGLVTEGSGRSTVFRLTVERGGHPVELDHLSGGETALVGAAFLSCLQGMKAGTGRLLLADLEALDLPSMARLLEALPRMGFDLVMVASNRADAAPEGWQVIELGGSR